LAVSDAGEKGYCALLPTTTSESDSAKKGTGHVKNHTKKLCVDAESW
jgi:hypothetical protein